MSDAENAPDQPDGIPEGKRIERVETREKLSLGDRIAAQLYRWSWRTPLHGLRLRGRYPLKLMEAPDDPVAGDADHGKAIIEGKLVWRGEAVSIRAGDFEMGNASPEWQAHFHSFDWLADLSATGDPQALIVAEQIVRHWLERFGAKVSEPAWRVDVAGKRLMNWPLHARTILAGNDLVYRSAVLNGLARTARHVERAADRGFPGAPRIAAWSGVVSAGLLLAGGEARRLHGEDGLISALKSSLSADGGVLSRSPTQQLDVVIILARLKAIYAACHVAMPSAIAGMVETAASVLKTVVLGDGALSSWQGSLPIESAEVERALAAIGARVKPLRQVSEWGYHRISAGKTVIVCDGAPPPQRFVCENGSASTLAFEMSDGAERLIVNCGGADSPRQSKQASLAEGLRTSAAHSVMVLADSNSTALLNGGGLGRGVEGVDLDRQETAAGSKIDISHDGYVRRFGFMQRRALALSPDGKELRGEDTLLPAEGRKKPIAGIFAIRFHLALGVEATPTSDGQGALIRTPKGATWQFRARGGMLSIEPSIWIDGNGALHRTQQIAINGEASAGGATAGWVLRRG
jgi:uncharacterized heparinase superfamily protein